MTLKLKVGSHILMISIKKLKDVTDKQKDTKAIEDYINQKKLSERFPNYNKKQLLIKSKQINQSQYTRHYNKKQTSSKS